MNKGHAIQARYSDLDLAAHDYDHPEWIKAQSVEITHYWSGEEAPVSRHAEARILWSEKSLGVRFVCNQNEPLVVSSDPQLDKKTIGLWYRDVCEIFMAPNEAEPNRYFEFEAAPTGEWLDLGIRLEPAGRETDWEFDSGMTAAARFSDDQLTVCMRIPWSESIPRPQAGEKWRINLFRCVGTGEQRHLAWQPTYTEEPSFHVPEAFGVLKFAKT
jgi:Carbohydrate family 9 binding domain-like